MGYSRLSLSMDDSVVEKARRLSDKTALLPKANAVMLEKGAKLELKSGMVKVTSLTVDGKVYPSGVYGSSTSGASKVDNTLFAGAGQLLVGKVGFSIIFR